MKESGGSFDAVFAALKPILGSQARKLTVSADKAGEYTLVTKKPSPFPQHKGQPMWFGSVKTGKAYVSFHLMPLYMDAGLQAGISPELKKRMQGKSCFNFKTAPEAEVSAELKKLTAAALERWEQRGWIR